jgi:hypothetical protein
MAKKILFYLFLTIFIFSVINLAINCIIFNKNCDKHEYLCRTKLDNNTCYIEIVNSTYQCKFDGKCIDYIFQCYVKDINICEYNTYCLWIEPLHFVNVLINVVELIIVELSITIFLAHRRNTINY